MGLDKVILFVDLQETLIVPRTFELQHFMVRELSLRFMDIHKGSAPFMVVYHIFFSAPLVWTKMLIIGLGNQHFLGLDLV